MPHAKDAKDAKGLTNLSPPWREANGVMQRADELGAISDEQGRLTRTFHSPAMQRANALVGSWMRDAGLEVREDAAFNLIGRWPCARAKAKTLLLGSHLDTVRDAGKYDGPLGVLIALAVVGQFKAEGAALPFHIEVIGFSDEEGVRYQTTYLGSRALADTPSGHQNPPAVIRTGTTRRPATSAATTEGDQAPRRPACPRVARTTVATSTAPIGSRP